ncbi:hypothetical protein [Barnesiella sp. CU968]|jgi:uncharacterized membrane protein YjgN (DUF898 family)|uniref:hypothetical protein n=1 Tax=Barnesiella sp. CU968 TaxID=2780099 RepID=UPI00195C3289|nr:hypothetical protein [Barnesiella sp. CU968]MBJ2197558.1 hypothetical protein [Muribaculaceae bacterium]MCI9030712.1 hypothetical protein [Muribaculaceae bacterium]
MRSMRDLIHDAIYPNTRVYHDANGNYRGSSTDVTPFLTLLGRCWGWMVWLYLVLIPLLAPVYFIFAHWFCRKYDAAFMASDPVGWPVEKKSILKNHRNILIGWIIFMVYGYCIDWGQNDLPYKYTQPSQHWKEATYDPDTYVDPYKQYKENNIR